MKTQREKYTALQGIKALNGVLENVINHCDNEMIVNDVIEYKPSLEAVINSHEALVEACQELLKAIDANVDEGEIKHQYIADELEMITQALLKAKGE